MMLVDAVARCAVVLLAMGPLGRFSLCSINSDRNEINNS